MIAEREESLGKTAPGDAYQKEETGDPLQFEMSIQAEDLSGYVPAFGWEMAPPSDKQKQELEKEDPSDEIDNAGKANSILDRLHKRQEEGLTTPKWIRCPEKYGFQHVGTWTFEAGKNMIDRIAAWAGEEPQEVWTQEIMYLKIKE